VTQPPAAQSPAAQPPAAQPPAAQAPAAPARRIPYQPALDGLRALAILTILLYHGQVPWPRGGYLGVDLFFVLSGYLITTLLLAEWGSRGAIDLKRFWFGRARRLLPALFLMLAGVGAYAALLAPATGLARIRGDALATLLYVANWRFAFTHLSYFEQFGDSSPLTHMWSLGIEEQYYLIWPLALIVGLRLARGRLRPLLAGTLLAMLASALTMAALYRPGVDPSRLYYGTDTRAQALLLGGGLALLLALRGQRPLPTAVVQTAAIIGFGGLLAMLLLVPDSARWLYLGGFTLAAAASGLMVMAAAQPGGWLRRSFSTAPLPAVGRISYGLYLWHWPLFVAISPERVHLHGAWLLVLRLAATFAAAVLSYRLVELPIRRGVLRRQPLARPLTAGAAAAVVALLLLTTTPGRVPAAEGAALSRDTGSARLPTVTTSPTTSAPSRAQPPRPAGDGFRVYLVGDSVGFTLGYNYSSGTVRGMTLGGDTELGCGLARAPIVLGGAAQPVDPKCTTWPGQWGAETAAFRPDVTLLLLGAWEVLDHQVGGRVLRTGTPEYERYLTGELQLADDLVAPSSRRVAILNVPCYHQPDTGLDRSLAETRDDPSRGEWLNQVLGRFVAAHSDHMVLLDLKGLLCPGGRYVDRIDGVRVRYDGVHFTKAGARVVWQWLGPRLRSLATQ
jgi:peptidoglycan/LPS O-acetylase OafA/YrhL